MGERKIRVGIDVGGTHTKAVALDNETHEIIGESVVMTTHDHEMGVAAGVIECFENCLTKNNIDPDDVVFIAHSTTQATNALLEGDVAKVGIIGMANGGIEGWLSKKQSNIPDIDLGTGRFIRTCHTFIKLKDVNEQTVEAAIQKLQAEGAQVIVASKAFGVDSIKEELLVRDIAEKHGLLVSVASDISKLYGLTRRTRTAAINGSILPKMMNTATSTEQSVRHAGIDVPLMIMRGDGGVMDISEMKKRPVLTMLSGPAASVMGALMYLRASNGIYFEVGGTSTNIGVIKNGRPAVEYSVVGGHRTYINSLDVRVLGVAGGSMVRAADGKLVDVGPRSAHIGGLKYAVYTPLEEIEAPELEFFAPKEGDPADYVRIKLASGKRVTITNSCAANVLGLVKENDYSYGIVESARKCMQPLADYLGVSVEECARQILHKAFEKIEPVIDELVEKYRIEKDQSTLVGVGGGASALLPYSANQMNMNYSIPKYAEVISSIGVALAMIRDVVERVIPNPTTEDISKIKKEAAALAIKNGAVPEIRGGADRNRPADLQGDGHCHGLERGADNQPAFELRRGRGPQAGGRLYPRGEARRCEDAGADGCVLCVRLRDERQAAGASCGPPRLHQGAGGRRHCRHLQGGGLEGNRGGHVETAACLQDGHGAHAGCVPVRGRQGAGFLQHGQPRAA